MKKTISSLSYRAKKKTINSLSYMVEKNNATSHRSQTQSLDYLSNMKKRDRIWSSKWHIDCRYNPHKHIHKSIKECTIWKLNIAWWWCESLKHTKFITTQHVRSSYKRRRIKWPTVPIGHLLIHGNKISKHHKWGGCKEPSSKNGPSASSSLKVTKLL